MGVTRPADASEADGRDMSDAKGFVQATGMGNDHVATCFRFKELWGD